MAILSPTESGMIINQVYRRGVGKWANQHLVERAYAFMQLHRKRGRGMGDVF
jgi:hypothetical protein